MTQSLSNNLLNWYDNNKRQLPWRKNTEPYLVWLSEIILQQTQVKQGLAYYIKITEAYPTVLHLAKATDDEFYTYWAGLGYYSRARNLIKSAKIIVNELGGILPKTKKDLLMLPGVGDYTASAIASISYDEKVMAFDGNLMRVFSRLFAFEKDLKIEKNKQALKQMAEIYLPNKRIGDFNQAVMDLGASICTKSKAKCVECPISQYCLARQKGIQDSLPFKSKSVKKEELNIHFFINNDNCVFLKRREKGIWQNLYELPSIWKNMKGDVIYENSNLSKSCINESNLVWEMKHLLTHKVLNIKVYKIAFDFDAGFVKVEHSKLSKYALPRPLSKYLTVN